MRNIFIVMVVVFLSGCVSWMKAEGLHQEPAHNFSVELPKTWMKFVHKDYLLLSRDGVLLQNILITRISIDKKLQFTKKQFKPEMLPQEAAEVFLDNFRSNQSKFNFKVVENIPCEVSGVPGFKVTCRYKNKDGLRIKKVCYGLLFNNYFYEIIYTAAERYYFDKNLQIFEQVVKNFKLLELSRLTMTFSEISI